MPRLDTRIAADAGGTSHLGESARPRAGILSACRRAEKRDYPAVSSLLRDCWKEAKLILPWAPQELDDALGGSSQRIVILSEVGGKPAGIAAAGTDWRAIEPGALHYELAYVRPEYRGTDVAAGQSRAIIEFARGRSSRVIAEPETAACRKHLRGAGFSLVDTALLLEEEPASMTRRGDGTYTYLYDVVGIPLRLPDTIAVLDL